MGISCAEESRMQLMFETTARLRSGCVGYVLPGARCGESEYTGRINTDAYNDMTFGSRIFPSPIENSSIVAYGTWGSHAACAS